MKVVFWSTLHGQASTSNMLLVALAASVIYQKKTLITQSHYNLNQLENPLIGRVEEDDFYRDTGLDSVIRWIKSSELTNDILKNCSVSVIKDRLDFLIGTKQMDRSVFESDVTRLMTKIINRCDKYYELVFIDTNSGECSLSKKLLKESDVIVVNLKQNKRVIEDFFRTYDKEFYKKTFYIFGSYDKESRFSLFNLRLKYQHLNRHNSGVIPYNIEFSDSFSDGSLLQYFYSNMNPDEDYISESFFDEVYQTTEKLLRFGGMDMRRGGRNYAI